MLRKGIIIFLLLISCMLKVETSSANGEFSYVYIQGDKNIPFYVKLDDIMLPRYGKNYFIIPKLVSGTIDIQILFQQNKYPPHNFTIKVPSNGFRGFILMNKSGTFTLYDIHQKFYLQHNNSVEDDNAPETKGYVYKPANITTQTTVPTNVTAGTSNNTPKFLENIELNKSNSTEAETIEKTPEKPIAVNAEKKVDKTVRVEYNRTSVVNSDCPQAISEDDFGDLVDKVQNKNESVRLKYLLSKMDDCYTSNQAGRLARILTNDPERYTFLKRIYPRVTNQNAFVALEDLLSTNEWKSYFRLIVSN